MNYIEFCNELSGYTFHNKQGKQVYRFEMFWSGLTPSQCFSRFETRRIVKQVAY